MSAPDPEQTTPTDWPRPVTDQPPMFDQGTTFDLHGPVDLTQLTDEIGNATKRTVTLAMSGPVDGNQAISEQNPAVLGVNPGDVDRDVVEKVIADHQPMPEYGVPESEKRYTAAVQKIVEDPSYELSPEETQAVLRGLVLRSLSSFPG